MTRPRATTRAAAAVSALSAERLARYAGCLDEGMTPAEAACRTGVTIRTAARYQARIAAGETAAIPPADPGRVKVPSAPSKRDELFESLIGPAMELAWIVHDGDPADGAAMIAALSPAQQAALPYVLAAMIDVDSGRTPQDLLAWAQPCGTTGRRVADCPHCQWTGAPR